MAQRTEEQGYTYQQLRDEISSLIASSNELDIRDLITSKNVQVVQSCAPLLVSAETQTNTKSLVLLHSECTFFNTAIGKTTIVDEALSFFNSTYVNLSNFCKQVEETKQDLTAFVQLIDTTSFAKNDDLCS